MDYKFINKIGKLVFKNVRISTGEPTSDCFRPVPNVLTGIFRSETIHCITDFERTQFCPILNDCFLKKTQRYD